MREGALAGAKSVVGGGGPRHPGRRGEVKKTESAAEGGQRSSRRGKTYSLCG